MRLLKLKKIFIALSYLASMTIIIGCESAETEECVHYKSQRYDIKIIHETLVFTDTFTDDFTLEERVEQKSYSILEKKNNDKFDWFLVKDMNNENYTFFIKYQDSKERVFFWLPSIHSEYETKEELYSEFEKFNAGISSNGYENPVDNLNEYEVLNCN